jgi:hypothetical protein
MRCDALGCASRAPQCVLRSLPPSAGGSQLVLIPASGGKIIPFFPTKSSETNGQISPGGKWVACASNESGDWEIYVTTFPTAAGKWQVSRGGNLTPVPVRSAGTFAASNPAALFRTQLRAPVPSTDQFSYDAAEDGQRLLVNRYANPAPVDPRYIILNGTAAAAKSSRPRGAQRASGRC